MQKLIGIFVTLLFAIATTAPFMSHATPNDLYVGKAAAQVQQAGEVHDCHNHGKENSEPAKTTQNHKDTSDTCCDKGVCKCTSNSCNGGLAGISGNGGISLLSVNYNKSLFNFANNFTASAFPERLKRPPRA